MTSPAYAPYRGLPPLAGVCSFEDAGREGLSVAECVLRLKRHHWAFRRLHEIFIKRLTAEPIYELKMAFSLHAHYCAEHAAAWRERVGEMREPPLGLDEVPHPALDAFFDEIRATPTTAALLVGIYGHALPALAEALRRHLGQTNPLVDHPTVRIVRFALLEIDEMLRYGRGALDALVSPQQQAELGEWQQLLEELVRLAGALDGSAPRAAQPFVRMYSSQPYTYDKVPRRDERFFDPYNMGVHAEVLLYDPAMPANAKALMMFYKRLREIDVPEMMASILTETSPQPWEYSVDMTRQVWDEARHAMMGEVGFLQAGIDWRKYVPVNFTWSLALNTQLKPLERHAVLYYIEQGLMPRTGKRFEWEVGVASDLPFAALCQDYDWADEVLHARIGRDWYVKPLGDARRAVEFGDQCWSRVLIDWGNYRERGLTRHANWWPALYTEFCRLRGETPDPAVLAYATSYEQTRADLKDLSVSG